VGQQRTSRLCALGGQHRGGVRAGTVLPLQAGAVQEPWITKRQLAMHCGVSTRTVERWLRAGCPSTLRASKRVFQLSVVDTWLASKEGR
jgi:hypothetical protein